MIVLVPVALKSEIIIIIINKNSQYFDIPVKLSVARSGLGGKKQD